MAEMKHTGAKIYDVCSYYSLILKYVGSSIMIFNFLKRFSLVLILTSLLPLSQEVIRLTDWLCFLWTKFYAWNCGCVSFFMIFNFLLWIFIISILAIFPLGDFFFLSKLLVYSSVLQSLPSCNHLVSLVWPCCISFQVLIKYIIK